MVLKKPAVSFSQCSSEMPTSLLIGSEAKLIIKSVESDNFDAPWEVSLSYQPPVDAKSSKQVKPWKKTLKADGKSLIFSASTPGIYRILGVTGKVGAVILVNTRSDPLLVLYRNRFCTRLLQSCRETSSVCWNWMETNSRMVSRRCCMLIVLTNSLISSKFRRYRRFCFSYLAWHASISNIL